MTYNATFVFWNKQFVKAYLVLTTRYSAQAEKGFSKTPFVQLNVIALRHSIFTLIFSQRVCVYSTIDEFWPPCSQVLNFYALFTWEENNWNPRSYLQLTSEWPRLVDCTVPTYVEFIFDVCALFAPYSVTGVVLMTIFFCWNSSVLPFTFEWVVWKILRVGLAF